ncbi:hypothetical protein NJO91_17545 [Streptomyces microflavus]|uniref:hypothetical protein n=1 Tax=Streptomyces microflavus TaxID=1919 RepID=UPI0029B9E303|nr:hypothetical protein [Streptomyces microflavus]MDX2404912.1 hypothetical protein [Streptomyces microflavus]
MELERRTIRPLAYGYVRALPELRADAVAQLQSELARFAHQEGFSLAEVFVEQRWLHTVAWDALVASCKQHGVRNVVVPDYQHLHSLPGLSFVMQQVIEDVIDGRVWCARSDAAVEEATVSSVGSAAE